MSASTGYVTDIEYPRSFFEEQSPGYLNFACILNGVEPVPIDKPFNYFELGFGQGATVSINAAANPQGQFYAADFNPAHVATARDLAEAARLENLTLLESSFAELAAGKVALPQFDFITMYGVYSWVNAENRGHIVNILSRYLKPGGIVFLNYNAMPGWSPALPLQRLILDHVDLYPSGKEEQVGRARALIQDMIAAKAAYFDASKSEILQTKIESLAKNNVGYLAHEFMNKGWDALHHADVARNLAAAKLNYVGSATLSQSFPDLYLTSAQQELLGRIQDPLLRETVRDYIQNTCFRQDIFVRGARRMTSMRREQWLTRMGLALIAIRETAQTCMQTPLGDTSPDEHLYAAVIDALAESPRTLAELAALPELRGAGIEKFLEIAVVLITSKQACPYSAHAVALNSESATRMNLVIADHACVDDSWQTLVSPLLGTGVGAGLIQRLVFRKLAWQPEAVDVEGLIAEIDGLLEERGLLLRDGERITRPEEIRAEIERVVRAILGARVPIWRQLNMLGPTSA